MFDSLRKMFEKNAKTISLKAVEDGRTIPMDEVNDQTFAQELLGPGIAIVPSNGTVVSPINGTRILMRLNCNTRIHRVIFNIIRLIKKPVIVLLSRSMM